MRTDAQQTALQYAMRKLNRRFYSRRAMSGMLSEEGYDEASVEDALAQLEQWGYLDDLRLARNQLRRYTARQPKGRLWIGRRLTQEGIEPDAIHQALEEYTDRQESALAMEAAKHFLQLRTQSKPRPEPQSEPQSEPRSEPQFKARTPDKTGGALARFLAARGFSPAIIHEILCEFRFIGASDLDSDGNWH
ncbi:MAG: recombination regulator RecX [Peptococcaceae bacterium]|jgi:regulatory protein|nr:recombination regulator RecX [Peptococcaceae bacterium]